MLDSMISMDGLATGRSLRDRKPVTYTFGMHHMCSLSICSLLLFTVSINFQFAHCLELKRSPEMTNVMKLFNFLLPTHPPKHACTFPIKHAYMHAHLQYYISRKLNESQGVLKNYCSIHVICNNKKYRLMRCTA